MEEGLHKVFKAIVDELKYAFNNLVESGSEVSHFILEHSNFVEVKRLPADAKKVWLKTTLK